MNRILGSVAAVVVTVGLVASGCTQAVPAPAPTAAPAKPAATPTTAPVAKPVEATKVPTAAPTAAPAKKAGFPEKGKTITFIVPWNPGGPTDVSARIVGGQLEKELGAPVQIVNKPGASSQVGLTELARSKPDGYTIITANQPGVAITYLDPEAKAIYALKDFQPVAMYSYEPFVLAVKADSPFKNLKDLVDAAKARPEAVKIGTAGLLSSTHFVALLLEQVAGVKVTKVHLEGGGPATTALLGGHIDAASINGTAIVTQLKSGAARLLGVTDRDESEFYPGVKTFEAQGCNVYLLASTGIAAPAGTPKDVVDILSEAIRRALDNEEVKKKMYELSYTRRYAGPSEYLADWESAEKTARQLLPLMRQ